MLAITQSIFQGAAIRSARLQVRSALSRSGARFSAALVWFRLCALSLACGGQASCRKAFIRRCCAGQAGPPQPRAPPLAARAESTAWFVSAALLCLRSEGALSPRRLSYPAARFSVQLLLTSAPPRPGQAQGGCPQRGVYVPRREDLRHLHRVHAVRARLPHRRAGDGALGRLPRGPDCLRAAHGGLRRLQALRGCLPHRLPVRARVPGRRGASPAPLGFAAPSHATRSQTTRSMGLAY